jgi:hypothetical protein
MTRSHDTFNLCLLPVLVAVDSAVLLGLFDPSAFTWLFTAYTVADLLWIWVRPQAVPQPALVLTHHVGVLALLSHPLRWPEHAIFSACVAIVEVNTVILVARRHFAGFLILDEPGTSLGALARSTARQGLSALYWSSFLSIRFGVHPYMVHVALTMAAPLAERLLVGGLLALLCVFSLVLLSKQVPRDASYFTIGFITVRRY